MFIKKITLSIAGIAITVPLLALPCQAVLLYNSNVFIWVFAGIVAVAAGLVIFFSKYFTKAQNSMQAHAAGKAPMQLVSTSKACTYTKSIRYQEFESQAAALRNELGQTTHEQERLLIDARLLAVETEQERYRLLADTLDELLANANTQANVLVEEVKKQVNEGNYPEANALLDAEVLYNGQQLLIGEKEISAQTREEIWDNLSHNAFEYLLKALLTELADQNEDWAKRAAEYYVRSVRSFRNFDNLSLYGCFLQRRGQEDAALSQYQECTDAGGDMDNVRLARVKHNMGTLYMRQQQYNLAKKSYEIALALRRDLASSNPDANTSELIDTLLETAALYDDLGWFDKETKLLNEALNNARAIKSRNEQQGLAEISRVLNQTGNYYTARTTGEKAEAVLQEALKNYRTLAQQRPMVYMPYMCNVLNNLGTLYSNTEKFTKAEQAYSEAVELYNRLASADNSDGFILKQVLTLHNAGLFYFFEQENEMQSKSYFRKALELLEKLPASEQKEKLTIDLNDFIAQWDELMGNKA